MHEGPGDEPTLLGQISAVLATASQCHSPMNRLSTDLTFEMRVAGFVAFAPNFRIQQPREVLYDTWTVSPVSACHIPSATRNSSIQDGNDLVLSHPWFLPNNSPGAGRLVFANDFMYCTHLIADSTNTPYKLPTTVDAALWDMSNSMGCARIFSALRSFCVSICAS